MVGLAHFPVRAAIEAYGEGGFRFAGMSHKGSLLLTASGIYAWDVSEAAAIDIASLQSVLDDAERVDHLIVGTGALQTAIDPAIGPALSEVGIGLEIMDTGAAARTYNILLAEDRDVAAALIAVGAG